MEEKRTPLTIAENILDNIFSIADKFISGLTTIGKKIGHPDFIVDVREQPDNLFALQGNSVASLLPF